ncbi:MAG: hypothetical protein HC851_17535 [Acaryochloris sp. RU_4_1]|nr:hypothetical protein [Acaryochloris sp. RU_4_1]NJR57230.1 hypothetical protein [Acaryochloris sp. CRU_2_0]
MTLSSKSTPQDSGLNEWFKHFFGYSYRTYHYNFDELGQSFVINEIEGTSGCYHMTAQGPRVKLGDSIEIRQLERTSKYQVNDIEYYGEPSDMWIALLREVPS